MISTLPGGLLNVKSLNNGGGGGGGGGIWYDTRLNSEVDWSGKIGFTNHEVDKTNKRWHLV